MATKGEPITTRMEMDISDLKAGIQEANRQIKLANSAFKATASEMDFVADSADGLSAKIRQLSTIHGAEQQKLEILQEQYRRVAEEQGENSTAAQNLEIKINNQQATVNKTAAQLKEYQDRLDNVSNASDDVEAAVEDQRNAYEKLQDTIDDQESTLKTLKDAYANVVLEQGDSSDAARDLAQEIEDLSSELNDNKKRLSDAEDAADSFTTSVEDLGDAAEESDDGFTVLKGALAEFAGNVITGAANGIRDLVGSLFEMSEATEEYRSMMSKISGSAESFGYSVDFARGQYENFYKYVADDQMATNAITNLMGMKVSTDTVSDAADAAIAVWSAYGDSIPIESLTESINESAQVGQVTGALADTINWAARSNEDWSKAMDGHGEAQAAFNKAVEEGEAVEDAYSAALAACVDTQERADLIAQTLNQTYGASKNTYDQLSQSTLEANEAELKLKDTQAELGKAVEPVNTAITNLKTKALDAITPAITTVADHFSDFLNWLLESPEAMSVVVPIVEGLAAAFGVLATALGIQALISGVQKAFALLNTTMLANPIVLIVAAIAGLVAAFIHLWNTSEEFRNFWIGVWDAIVQFCSDAVENIKTFFTVTVPGAINTMVTFFQELPGKIASFLSQIISNAVSWAADFGAKALAAGSDFLSNVVNFVQQLPGKISSFLSDIITKVITWASDLISKGKTAASDFLNGVVNFVKELPGKFSSFLTDVISKVTSWASDIVSDAKSAGSDFVTGVIDFIQDLPDKFWTWLKSSATKVTTWATDIVSDAENAGSDFLDGVITAITELPTKFGEKLTDIITNVGTWATDLAAKGLEAAQSLATAIVDEASKIPGQMLDIGASIVSGVWEGIQNAAGTFVENVKGFFGGIVNDAKSALGIHSPSTVFRDQVGKNIVAGVAEGIGRASGTAVKSMVNLANTLVNSAKKAVRTNKYSEIGESVVESFSTGIDKYTSKAINSVTKLVNQQVKAMTKSNKKNKKKYESAGEDVIDTFSSAMERAGRKAVRTIESQMTKIADAAQEKIDEVLSQRDAMKESLSDFDELYSFDDEGNMVVTNLGDTISKMQQYDKNLTTLKGKVSDALLAEIANMDVNDALSYTSALLNMSASELQAYNNKYSKMQSLATSISKKFYQDQIDAIKTNYTDKVTALFGSVTTQLEKAGSDAILGFVNGMTSADGRLTNAVKKAADSILLEFKNKLQINSPSKVFESFGEFSGLGYIQGLNGSLKRAKSAVAAMMPAAVAGASSGVRAAAGASSGVQSVTLNQYNTSPKALSRLEIYRQTKNLLKGATMNVQFNG